MKFIADLHIHSRFSRATARTLDFEHLYISAQLKGITVVGTGDVTHPGWFAEIHEKLVPAEPGLFRLNNTAARIADTQVPLSCRRPVRFLLSSEISCIYKKNGQTRKNHNLVFFPNSQSAAAFIKRLEKIGNITADGRPVLSLDAKNLLEIVLESSDRAFLIPAHIWTPWFSLLGSKFGFDSVEECFEELTAHIFALETGLSSDPSMNWRVSGLDKMTLVSNSDAHSPEKLGREANLFNTDLSFDGLRSALKTGDPDQFLGTFEFHPEEGKYHLDGHRNCNIYLQPSETNAIGGKCPICGKLLTRGVLSRVEMLSDRPKGIAPIRKQLVAKLVTLTDILSEIFQVGPNTKKVKKNHDTIIAKLGSELTVLSELSINEIERAGVPLLAEAIERIRLNKLDIIPGYDGRYGRIRIFNNQERRRAMGQRTTFTIPVQLHSIEPKQPEFL
jgi:DNA helicase II / ATP-dependent DNA helicase PcrA